MTLSVALTDLNNAAYAAARVARKQDHPAASALKALALHTDDLKDGVTPPAISPPVFSAFGTCQALREIMVRGQINGAADTDALYAAVRLLETAQKAGAV